MCVCVPACADVRLKKNEEGKIRDMRERDFFKGVVPSIASCISGIRTRMHTNRHGQPVSPRKQQQQQLGVQRGEKSKVGAEFEIT